MKEPLVQYVPIDDLFDGPKGEKALEDNLDWAVEQHGVDFDLGDWCGEICYQDKDGSFKSIDNLKLFVRIQQFQHEPPD